MEIILFIAAFIFGMYHFRSVKKFNKKLNREDGKAGKPLDRFL